MKLNKQRLMQIIKEELNEMGMGIGIPDKLPTGPAKNPPKKLPGAMGKLAQHVHSPDHPLNKLQSIVLEAMEMGIDAKEMVRVVQELYESEEMYGDF